MSLDSGRNKDSRGDEMSKTLTGFCMDHLHGRDLVTAAISKSVSEVGIEELQTSSLDINTWDSGRTMTSEI
jgi:hypothetical protein